jgi:hypothetical protein
MILMAKCELEDGRIISSSHLYDELVRNENRDVKSVQEYLEEHMPAHIEVFDIEKLKEPHGRHNYEKIGNISKGDMLIHIQQTLSIKNQCIIDIITGHPMRCLNHNETIDRTVKSFASKFITNELREIYPRQEYNDGRVESDDDWECRLCHLIMQHNHPKKLQMIKCSECIRVWMNSEKW